MAQGDFFLKIDGIKGESKDSKHTEEIDIDSYTIGATNSGSMSGGGGGGAGVANVQDMHFTALMSKASPKLLQACTSGEHIKSAIFISRVQGKEQQEFLTIKLTDLIISSYQTGAHGSERPSEQFSLNFAKIEMDYKEQKIDGTLGGSTKAGWDLKAKKVV